jgi:hypothetical protein
VVKHVVTGELFGAMAGSIIATKMATRECLMHRVRHAGFVRAC